MSEALGRSGFLFQKLQKCVRLPHPGIRAMQPILDPGIPKCRKLPVLGEQPAIGLPAHLRRLGRETIVEIAGPRRTTALLQKLAQAPAPAADVHGLVLILGFVACPQTLPAAKPIRAVQYPAAARAIWTPEPMAAPAEPGGSGRDRQALDDHAAGAAHGIGQTQEVPLPESTGRMLARCRGASSRCGHCRRASVHQGGGAARPGRGHSRSLQPWR